MASQVPVLEVAHPEGFLAVVVSKHRLRGKEEVGKGKGRGGQRECRGTREKLHGWGRGKTGNDGPVKNAARGGGTLIYRPSTYLPTYIHTYIHTYIP